MGIEGAVHRELSLLDIAALLANLHEASRNPRVGFEDADQTLGELSGKLASRYVRINTKDLESALWASNLLDELGQFWHPNDVSFDQFVNKFCLAGESFNREYNFFTRRSST